MNGVYNLGDIVLGNWKLIRKIGEGSYGRVYEAEREDFGVTYKSAIKIITIPQSQGEISDARSEGMDEESVTAYFKGFVGELVQEIVLMSKLKGHSNIVGYEDHVVLPHENGIGWDIIIRMELLTPLMTYVQQHPLTRDDVVRLGRELCSALELCEQKHIVHRDIKPENIFVSDSGDFKLGDFGIARTVEKTTGGLSKKGTYTYMAPEVYKEQPYNANVDIYSLGIVMYRLLNENRAPFLPEPPQPISYNDRENALARRMSGEALPAPSHSDELLSRVVLKACAYRPEDRYSRPVEMKNDLAAVGRGEEPLAPEEEEKTVATFDVTAKTAPAAGFTEEKTESVFEAKPAAPRAKPASKAKPKAESKAEPKAETGKKSKLPLILGAAAVVVVAVAALALGGGGSDEPQSGGSTGGDVSVSEPAAPGEDEEAVAQTNISNEMLLGKYTVNSFPDKDIRPDLSDFSKGMKYMTLENMVNENYNGKEISVVPYQVNIMPAQSAVFRNFSEKTQQEVEEFREEFIAQYGEAQWQQFMDLKNYLYIEADYCDKMDGRWNRAGLAKVEGNKLLIYLNSTSDEQGNLIIPEEHDLEYKFDFKGKNLSLKGDGKKVEMVPYDFCDYITGNDYGPDLGHGTGYVANDREAWQDIAHISRYMSGSLDDSFIQFTDGGNAIDPVIELSGDNTITISWEEAWRPYNGSTNRVAESVKLTAEYLSCDDYGLVIIDDGKYYLYQSTERQYDEAKLAANLEGVSAADLSEDQVKDLKATQTSVLKDLDSALSSAGVNAQIDESNGVVTMDSSILFGFDDAALSSEGQAYLDGFFDVYSQVVLDEKYSGAISHILIEGHTDTDGEYDYNLTLSQQRAKSVADYCLGKRPELGSFITSKGCASDDPVYNADGSVNKEASRRVMFKFILNVR